jgi:hypothetical protein
MVFVSTLPIVVLPVLVRSVNVPAAAAVPPIAGGLARYVLNPVPETVLDADSVVNEPAAAAVPPIAGGLARYVLNPVPETVLDADSVVNAPVDAVVAPIDILLIVPIPVDVKARVGVLLAVSVIKLVYAAPSTSYAASARVLVAVCADRSTVPVTNCPLTVIVSATASPMVVLPVLLSVVNVPAAGVVPPIAGGLARYVLNPVPETVLLALNVVNAPAAAAVPPIAGGLAKYVLNPVPETVLLALNVVNAPAAAAVPPIAGGLAKYVLNPVPETVLLALNVVNAPVDAVVAPTEALLIAPPLIVGLVSVLLVSVWVTSMPTKVVVASGIVYVRVVPDVIPLA